MKIQVNAFYVPLVNLSFDSGSGFVLLLERLLAVSIKGGEVAPYSHKLHRRDHMEAYVVHSFGFAG